MRDHLQVNRLPELENLNEPCIFAKISSNKNNYFYLGIFYRSPNSTNEYNLKLCKQINEICSFLKNCDKNLILLGDFNYPDLNWNSEECSNANTHIFLDTIQNNMLLQKVNDNTHYKPNCNPSLIDLIFVNNGDLCNDIKIMPPFGKSHHVVLIFILIPLTLM